MQFYESSSPYMERGLTAVQKNNLRLITRVVNIVSSATRMLPTAEEEKEAEEQDKEKAAETNLCIREKEMARRRGCAQVFIVTSLLAGFWVYVFSVIFPQRTNVERIQQRIPNLMRTVDNIFQDEESRIQKVARVNNAEAHLGNKWIARSLDDKKELLDGIMNDNIASIHRTTNKTGVELAKQVWKDSIVTAPARLASRTLGPHPIYTPKDSYKGNNSFENINDIPLTSKQLENGYVVPNVVHYIRFGEKQREMSFVDMICIKSAYLNLRPDHIIIHADVYPEGKYWKRIAWISNIHVVYMKTPTRIYGQPIKVVQHASDVARLEVLLNYGGIYLDNDVYVVKSFDKFRTYNFSLGWPIKEDPEAWIGNQILIANKDSRFLREYFTLYKGDFQDNIWYYNAGQAPTMHLIKHGSDHIHIVQNDAGFGVMTGIGHVLFNPDYEKIFPWKTFYAIHLFYHHRFQLIPDDYKKYRNHNETTIRKYHAPFGAMARLIYYGTEEFV